MAHFQGFLDDQCQTLHKYIFILLNLNHHIKERKQWSGENGNYHNPTIDKAAKHLLAVLFCCVCVCLFTYGSKN